MVIGFLNDGLSMATTCAEISDQAFEGHLIPIKGWCQTGTINLEDLNDVFDGDAAERDDSLESLIVSFVAFH